MHLATAYDPIYDAEVCAVYALVPRILQEAVCMLMS